MNLDLRTVGVWIILGMASWVVVGAAVLLVVLLYRSLA